MLLKKGMFSGYVKTIQEYLTALGFDTNGVEGDFGSGTERAVKEFQRVMGLEVDGVVGNGTASKLASVYYGKVVGKVPAWVSEALKDYFISEVKGEKHAPRVLQMWKDAKLSGIKDDETPWCAGAVSAWLERSGIKSQRSAWARGYLNQGIELDEPKFGAIAVFERGKGGHVGFVTGVTADGRYVKCIGGNQANMVCESLFDVTRVLGYRNPTDVELEDAPVVGRGVISIDEA